VRPRDLASAAAQMLGAPICWNCNTTLGTRGVLRVTGPSHWTEPARRFCSQKCVDRWVEAVVPNSSVQIEITEEGA